jgi:uncharacterized protein (DUF1778 family)
MRAPFPQGKLPPETQMRPPDDPILSARFANANEVDLIKRAAKSMGLNPSAFIRLAALERANVVAQERPRVRDGKARPLNRPQLTVVRGGKR